MMAEYGWGEEAFGYQMVAQRRWAQLNPRAFHRDPLSIDDYMESRYVSEPLRLLDCDYPIDASGCVIFTTEERARDLAHRPVFVESGAFGTASRSSFELQEDMTRTSPHAAAARLWSRTSLTAADVDVAGLYDGFSPIVMTWLEALGLCGRGEAADFVREGNTAPGGRLPLNSDGGMVNVGRIHGVNHVAEVVHQLRGTAGPSQQTDVHVGVAGNSFGPGSACMLFTDD
jgi:acetyl-CoA acetyltransferase